MSRKSLLLAAVSSGSMLLGAEQSAHLAEVMALLDLNRSGMEKIKAAETPDEQGTAIKEYFSTRANVPAFAAKTTFSERETARARKTTDETMKHVFRATSGQQSSFRGKEIDWDNNPYSDPEWMWGFHRWGWLRPLAVTYNVTKDENYALEYAAEVRSYVKRMHRADAFAAPDRKAHMGWRHLDTAIRVQTWVSCFFAFAKSPSVSPSAVVDCLYHIHACATRCIGDANPDRGTVYNWNLTILDGALSVALAFPEFRSSTECRELGLKTATAYASRIINEDGTSVELIPGYHGVYVRWLAETKQRFVEAGVDAVVIAGIDELLTKSIDAQIVWSHPNGTMPLFGDTKGENIGAMQKIVQREFARNPRPEWQYYLTEGKEGKAPDKRILRLEDAGYTVFRSDWTKNAIALIAMNTNFEGKPRRGHCAADNMGFELSAYGRRLMCDSGSYVYWGKRGWHDYFRTSQTHQVLSLNDNLNASRGRIVLTTSVCGLDVAVLENMANEDFLHRRTFLFVDNQYFLIVDQAVGDASGTLRQHFQFVPCEWVMDSGRLRARTLFSEGTNLMVATMDQPGLSLAAEDGWISVNYTKKEPRPAFYFQQEKLPNKDSHFLTLLAPMDEERQIWHVDLCFLKDGKRTSEIQNTIYLCLNHQDAYIIDSDFEAGQFAVEKRVYGEDSNAAITHQINEELHKTGTWRAPEGIQKSEE